MVFAHGLLLDHTMFAGQVAPLQDHFRCIAYDHRGQGRSEVPPEGYDMDTLAADAAALISQLDAAPCHFIGLSMGGFVGLRLALDYPELLRSLVLIDSSADPEPADSARKYRRMAGLARWIGLRPLVGRIIPIIFGETFLADQSRSDELRHWRDRIVGADRKGILNSARAVIERDGLADRLGEIRTPTLIIVGEEDHATPLVRAQRMHQGIAGSRLAVVPRAGHSSTIEAPGAVSTEIARFLQATWTNP